MKGKVAAGLVSAIVMLVGAGSAAAQVLPVGTWSFNEGSGTVAHDIAWPPDNGTLSGGVQWIRGRFGDALNFDGATGAVQVPDSPALEPSQITVSAWVKASSSPGNFKYIVAKGANGCLTGTYGLYTGANGGLEFYVANSDLTYVDSPDAGSSVWDGSWHNVIGTYDGSTVRLYVDGVQVGSGSADSSPIAYGLPTTNALTIGNYTGCSGLGYNGSIDEVKVFDRALGAQEIRLGVKTSQLLPSIFPTDAVL
jgi:Concanavalin A-like lectin/glucanases superfamily